ncbi:nuclear transport factor 2 family protein [Flavobacterium johnsoniae]|uniref:nuclear transport factor 2 family protein n=1 Tax=Flavobacterium johnsoniae TaxID=986 RepID=UPI0011F0292B|nr:nuclear transport factor 2 family protein [Flavobacterium johnsoniae]
MKTAITILLLFVSLNFISAQQTSKDKEEIHQLLNSFMQSIVKKDSVTFNSLFFKGNVNWIGVIKEKSQAKTIEDNPSIVKNYFTSTYTSFIQSILRDKKSEEKFENIVIQNDDAIASVTFDYSFWSEDSMTNWGNEYWQLVKINGQWKISSVLFSIEISKYYPKS